MEEKELMNVAAEEIRLATELKTGTADAVAAAATERELSGDLLALARGEGQMAGELMALKRENDYGPVLLAEQAKWNRDLLRHVARTATEADRALRSDQSHP